MHYQLITEDQGDPCTVGKSTTLFHGLGRSTVFSRFPLQHPREFQVASFSTILLYAQILTNAPTRTSFQWFLSNPAFSSFKKLIVLTLSLRQGLHTMSKSKVVPDVLRNHECKRTALRERPPVPYVPEKDELQEVVSSMKGLQLKTSTGEDTTLHFPVWNICTKKAMLMHVMATLDTIKKRGHFQDYETAQALYVAKKEAAKQAKTGLALFDGVRDGTDKSKKSSKKAKEAEATTKASD